MDDPEAIVERSRKISDAANAVLHEISNLSCGDQISAILFMIKNEWALVAAKAAQSIAEAETGSRWEDLDDAEQADLIRNCGAALEVVAPMIRKDAAMEAVEACASFISCAGPGACTTALKDGSCPHTLCPHASAEEMRREVPKILGIDDA